ncbi:AMP-binding enzyme [Tessaracoccus coleopterorum]|uniref:AMP-binding enzyme n=1 Tax=Tessaracoccus coleopterorum TaxID=2714950 RepID=UPI001E3646E0|nr:hypothetical protein [Tessaracoccus coleopterorum]
MGAVMPGMRIEIIDPDTGLEARRERSPCRWSRGRSTSPRLSGRLPTAGPDGRYHSGDLVTVGADGYLTYVGRTDDVFKASDYKVSPFELESVLITHPAVLEAAIVPAPTPAPGRPEGLRGARPGFEPTADTALSILRHAKEHLAPYLRVRRIEFAELPKTVSGKIRRVVLRAREHDPSVEIVDFRYESFPELRG